MNAADEFSLFAIRVVVSFHAFVIAVVVVFAFLMWRSHRKYEREARARYEAFRDASVARDARRKRVQELTNAFNDSTKPEISGCQHRK